MEVLADGEDMSKFDDWCTDIISDCWEMMDADEIAKEAFAAGRCLGRDEWLEEAANVADLSTVYEKDKGHNPYTWNYRIAKAIRALKEQT